MPRANLPHRSSLSRFLADVDRPCARSLSYALRAVQLSEMHGPRKLLVASSIGKDAGTLSLMWMRHARRQRLRALPCDPMLPPARRRLDAVCAAGDIWRKRGEVVRTRTTARRDAYPSMDRHICESREWRLSRRTGFGEALHQDRAFRTSLSHQRQHRASLDGQYGDAVAITQRDTRQVSP
jgi:hypothetical protein